MANPKSGLGYDRVREFVFEESFEDEVRLGSQFVVSVGETVTPLDEEIGRYTQFVTTFSKNVTTDSKNVNPDFKTVATNFNESHHDFKLCHWQAMTVIRHRGKNPIRSD